VATTLPPTPDTPKPASSNAGTSSPPPRAKRSWLDVIESIGNKVPHPAIIFLGLCVLVIVLSALLAAFDVKVTYEVV
jgi:aminobenzoyl-glutamate transport protein